MADPSAITLSLSAEEPASTTRSSESSETILSTALTTRATSRTPSTTVFTSVVTKSATGTGASASPVVVTVTATSVADPDATASSEGPLVATFTTSGYTATVTFGNSSATASSFAEGNTSGGMEDTAKIALGVSIPLGIILLGLLVAGAYLWGKRASQAARTADVVETLSDKGTKKRSAETHELPPEGLRQELPTSFNLTEMSASDGPREMASQSPVELPSNENNR